MVDRYDSKTMKRAWVRVEKRGPVHDGRDGICLRRDGKAHMLQEKTGNLASGTGGKHASHVRSTRVVHGKRTSHTVNVRRTRELARKMAWNATKSTRNAYHLRRDKDTVEIFSVAIQGSTVSVLVDISQNGKGQ